MLGFLFIVLMLTVYLVGMVMGKSEQERVLSIGGYLRVAALMILAFFIFGGLMERMEAKDFVREYQIATEVLEKKQAHSREIGEPKPQRGFVDWQVTELNAQLDSLSEKRQTSFFDLFIPSVIEELEPLDINA